MHLATFPGPAKVRGVLRNWHSSRTARKEADKNGEVFIIWDNLFDAD
jgi:hypothetical protein